MISASISVMDHMQRIGFTCSLARQELTAGRDSVSSVPCHHSNQDARTAYTQEGYLVKRTDVEGISRISISNECSELIRLLIATILSNAEKKKDVFLPLNASVTRLLL